MREGAAEFPVDLSEHLTDRHTPTAPGRWPWPAALVLARAVPYGYPMPQVTGIGGVFIRAHDAESLRNWYSQHLGIPIDGDSGAQFTWTSGGSTAFSIFPASSPYFGRPDQPCMINFRVDDLHAMLAQLRAAGVEVIDDTAEAEYGKFGWAVDPEGNRFELWQPPSGA